MSSRGAPGLVWLLSESCPSFPWFVQGCLWLVLGFLALLVFYQNHEYILGLREVRVRCPPRPGPRVAHAPQTCCAVSTAYRSDVAGGGGVGGGALSSSVF